MGALDQWLSSEVVIVDGEPPRTVLSYLSELISVNGGRMVVSGYGTVRTGIGPYGRMGLTIVEAFALTNLGGIAHGLVLAGGDSAMIALKVAVQAEIDRIVAEGGADASGGVVLATEAEMRIAVEAYKRTGYARQTDAAGGSRGHSVRR